MDLNRLYTFCQTSLNGINTDRFRWYGYIERTENGIIPKQTATARMEGRGRRGMLREAETEEDEEDLKITDKINWYRMARDWKE
jgi:hypothetical protein